MSDQYDSRLFEEFFDWQPQSFVWLRPVWDGEGKTITDFEYTYSNEPGLKYLKLTREMLGKIRISNTPSLTDEMRPRIFNEMLHAFTTGQTVTIDMYNPVIDRYGTVFRMKFREGVLTTIQDKTQEKLAIIELNKRTKELQQFNESLKEFAYVASHDLQEPLRKIKTFVDRLKRDMPALGEVQKNIFTRIESSTVRMKELIDDLLTYSLASIREDEPKPVNLQEVLHDVLQDLEGVIKEAGAVISIGTLPEVKGDASQMHQLFQNLLSNAIKYRTKNETPKVMVQSRTIPSSDPLLIQFESLLHPSYQLIEVIDNGIGFEQQHEEKIFQVFQRLHGRSAYEGTGIGLAIVQKVVQNHHGFIKAISSPGKGATFQVFLPAN